MPILFTKEELLNDSYMQKIDVGRIGMCSVKYSGITKNKLDRETRDSYVRRVVSQAINDNIQSFEGQLATRDFYMGIDLNRDDSKFSGIKWIEDENDEYITLSVKLDRYTSDIDRKVILLYGFTVLNGPLPIQYAVVGPSAQTPIETLTTLDNPLDKSFDVHMFNPLIFLWKNSEAHFFFYFFKNYQKYYTMGEKPKLKLYGIVCEALTLHICG